MHKRSDREVARQVFFDSGLQKRRQDGNSFVTVGHQTTADYWDESAKLYLISVQIPFPERIPWIYGTSFAFLLLLLQLITGATELQFALLCFFFVLTAVTAFNVAGGLSRPSGSYVLFFALLTTIVGLITKVFFGEPGQSRLRIPIPLMETYLAGMVGMLLAVYLSSRLRLRRGLLEDFIRDDKLHGAVIGCVVVGVSFSVLAPLLDSGGAETIFTPVVRAARQLDRFLEMAIILGVTYQVRKSDGRQSLNLLVLIAWATIFFEGVVLGYSKEALFSPFFCWIIAAAVQGFRFRPLQIICAGVLFLFFYIYMVPYCQVGRVYRSTTNTFSQNLANSESLLVSLGEVRRKETQEAEDQAENFDPAQSLNYTALPHGLVDRLQMLSIDDTLHIVTDEYGASGLQVVWTYFLNAVPRVFWKNKPDILTANQYGHELGFLAPDDEATSVSVSPIGEAYRVAKWPGDRSSLAGSLVCSFLRCRFSMRRSAKISLGHPRYRYLRARRK